MNLQTDAGSVGASTKRYRVTFPHDHEHLKVGDIVIMTETPERLNYLIRESDMSLHAIRDRHDQYVHLEQVES